MYHSTPKVSGRAPLATCEDLTGIASDDEAHDLELDLDTSRDLENSILESYLQVEPVSDTEGPSRVKIHDEEEYATTALHVIVDEYLSGEGSDAAHCVQGGDETLSTITCLLRNGADPVSKVSKKLPNKLWHIFIIHPAPKESIHFVSQ